MAAKRTYTLEQKVRVVVGGVPSGGGREGPVPPGRDQAGSLLRLDHEPC